MSYRILAVFTSFGNVEARRRRWESLGREIVCYARSRSLCDERVVDDEPGELGRYRGLGERRFVCYLSKVRMHIHSDQTITFF